MNEATCIFCKRDSNQIPLVAMQYQQQTYYICPQHIPLLIHEPEKLVGMLPGAESMNAAPTGD